MFVAALSLPAGAAALGCTIDETTNTDGSCTPVDCRTKYAGERNVWDTAQRLCVAAAECEADEIYEPDTNTCTLASSPDENYTSPLPPTDDDGLDDDGGLGGSDTLDCGKHGHRSSDNTTCICDEGWYTRTQQDAFSMTYCDTTSSDAVSADTGTLDSNSTDDGTVAFSGAGGGRATLSTVAISGICIFAALICTAAGCCAFQLRRKRRARHKRKEEEAARKLELSLSTTHGGASSFYSSTGCPGGVGGGGEGQVYGGGFLPAATFAHRHSPLSPAEQHAIYAATIAGHGGGMWPMLPMHGTIDSLARFASHTAPQGMPVRGAHEPPLDTIESSLDPFGRVSHKLRDNALLAVMHSQDVPKSSSQIRMHRASPELMAQSSDSTTARSPNGCATVDHMDIKLEARRARLAKNEYAERLAYLTQLNEIESANAMTPRSTGELVPVQGRSHSIDSFYAKNFEDSLAA